MVGLQPIDQDQCQSAVPPQSEILPMIKAEAEGDAASGSHGQSGATCSRVHFQKVKATHACLIEEVGLIAQPPAEVRVWEGSIRGEVFEFQRPRRPAADARCEKVMQAKNGWTPPRES